MRLKRLGVLNCYEHASNLSEERYLKSLLPVPQLVDSADELFGFDGTEILDKVWSLEIVNAHMRAPESRVNVAEEIDFVCPSWFAEQFIRRLLPQAIPSCFLDGVTNLHSPVKACEWFEDMEICSLVVAREIEPYMQDLPEASSRLTESLNQDMLQTYFHLAKGLVCLKLESSTRRQVQNVIRLGPSASPLARDEEHKEGISVLQMLDDADFNLREAKSMHQNSVKTFELQSSEQDSLLEQYSGQIIYYRELEEYAKTIVQNQSGYVSESDVEEPAKLLDFDPAAFMLDKLHIKPKIEQHELQSASSSYVVGLLDENWKFTDMKTGAKHAVKDTAKISFELPEVLEEENLNSFLSLQLRTYITTLMKPYPILLEDLDSQEIPFQDFENLLVLPELTLDPSSFHMLPVPSFNPDHQGCITEDVFKVFFRAKALPTPTSASDWLYLDWHLSQVGHCNNYGCFHLQRRLIENELHVTLLRDMIPGNRMPDLQLLLCLTEDFMPWRDANTECTKEEYTEANLHASVSTSVINFSEFVHTAAKAADKTHLDQSVLTDGPRNDFLSTRDEVSLAGSGPTSMDNVLSLIKQARHGVLSRDTKLMQVPENEDYQEGHVCNTKDQPHESLVDYHQVSESTFAFKIPIPNPSCSSVDAATSYFLQTSNHVEPELLVPLNTPACLSKGLLQTGFKSAPLVQPVYKELSPQQSQVEDIQWSGGYGPHLIVVANILQPNGPVLLQRRSSYQKILGLENEDLQVVERELKLPVDLILNPSTCLTIYTEQKLRYSNIRSLNSEEFFACVIDTIVDCHMKALSFSFQSWFMIFEGELAFTSAILPILSKLYICSAGFQMRVQGFISTNPIVTDSLVLRCIKKIWKMSKRPYDSPLSEDPTDGEVFLATFPSLNPLSSHAILCLNVPISTFISWSQEEQNSALQGFNIRAENLNLLQAQCVYGKLKTATHRGLFSACPWSAASEIVVPEVDSHVQADFTHFPLASEISKGDLEENSGDMPARDRNLYPPTRPDPILQYPSAEQGTFSWNGVCWPADHAEPSINLPHSDGRAQRPNFAQKKPDCCNPVDVRGFLQQWIQTRKGGKKYLNHSETESELLFDSFKIPSNESYRARPRLNSFPTSAESTPEAVYPTYTGQATDELPRASLLKTSRKRTVSAREQLRHQRGVSPTLRSQKKKLKPAVPTCSRDNGPSSQLDHSLKISRLSCYKFSPPFNRSV